MEITERITRLLEEKYSTDEVFADCFTVSVEMKPGQKLYVFADSDSGMTFEKCQKLSRYLESHIDSNGWLGEKYLLEVSSPGIGRPFQFLRQYNNNSRTLAVISQHTIGDFEITNRDVALCALSPLLWEREEKKHDNPKH